MSGDSSLDPATMPASPSWVASDVLKWHNGFDTVLPGICSDLGFKAEARLPFNDAYAPDGWDYDTHKKFNAGRRNM